VRAHVQALFLRYLQVLPPLKHWSLLKIAIAFESRAPRHKALRSTPAMRLGFPDGLGRLRAAIAGNSADYTNPDRDGSARRLTAPSGTKSLPNSHSKVLNISKKFLKPFYAETNQISLAYASAAQAQNSTLTREKLDKRRFFSFFNCR